MRPPRRINARGALLVWCAVVAIWAGLLWHVAGCGIQSVGGGAGIDLPYFDVVYQCSTADRGVLELCWDGDVSELELALPGICHPTNRHAGPCVYSCPSPPSGCNAYGGCFCPVEEGG